MEFAILFSALIVWACVFLMVRDFERSGKKCVDWINSLKQNKWFYLGCVLFGVGISVFNLQLHNWGDLVFGKGSLMTTAVFGFSLALIYGLGFSAAKVLSLNYSMELQNSGVNGHVDLKGYLREYSIKYRTFLLLLLPLWTLYLIALVAGMADPKAFGLIATILASVTGFLYLLFLLISLDQADGHMADRVQLYFLCVTGFLAVIGSLYFMQEWRGGETMLLASLGFLLLCAIITVLKWGEERVVRTRLKTNTLHSAFLLAFVGALLVF
ncbi:MAG: hypothetical protein EA411_12775 [Saprospirales bacterium]|nr:MAG: hypothetical protein EA411_12775 [Saprospirales bacterium]